MAVEVAAVLPLTRATAHSTAARTAAPPSTTSDPVMAPVPTQAASVVPSQCTDPPVCTLPAIPAPPSTISAPVVAEAAAVVPGSTPWLFLTVCSHKRWRALDVRGGALHRGADGGPALDDERPGHGPRADPGGVGRPVAVHGPTGVHVARDPGAAVHDQRAGGGRGGGRGARVHAMALFDAVFPQAMACA